MLQPRTPWQRCEPFAFVITLVTVLMGAAVTLDALAAFHAAYQRASLRLEDERWLLDNCKDPIFFSKMRAHTNVCEEVEANARVGVGWAALREVSDRLRGALRSLLSPILQPWLVMACCCAAGVLLLVPLCCAWQCGHAHRYSSNFSCVPSGHVPCGYIPSPIPGLVCGTPYRRLKGV